MTDQTTAASEFRGGMTRISAGLWIALGAAALQLSAIASDFYVVGENVRDAWFGIPHASDLILGSALVTVLLAALAAAGRSPVGGRTLGLIVGIVGLLATAQLAYRMVVPPFGGCLTYNCGATPKQDVTLLVGIWIGLVGCLGATLGGFAHAFSAAAKQTRPNFWTAAWQPGISPWLGLAALAAVGQFVFGYTFFDFYTVSFADGGPPRSWGGWLATPHTSSVVLVLSASIVGLVIAAVRRRSPMNPGALGATIALLAFVAATRILYRIIVTPFTSGAVEGTFAPGAEIHLPAYLAFASAVVALAAGIVYAAQHREPADERATKSQTRSGDPAAGSA